MVQSGQIRLAIWAEPILCSILTKKRGWVAIEDWKEVTMGVTSLELRDLEQTWGTSVDDWRLVTQYWKLGSRVQAAASEYLSHVQDAF
jgi:hypothetical protein